MEHQAIKFTDRLRDRGYIDQWGFALFAFLGSAGIFLAKLAAVDALWVALGAILVMLLYAVLIARKGSGRLAADQAGDNCYYLGLIYTLTSLSFAIIFFDPNDTATTIVQGFGVALGTTIVGLVLRVFFNQGRPDLENVEEQARLDLTAAATQLTTELHQVTVMMKDFTVHLQQSVTEIRDHAADQITEFATTSVDGLKKVVDTADQAIRAQANDFAERSKRYSSSFDSLISKLEMHTEKVGELADAHGILIESSKEIKAAALDARDTVAGFEEGADATREAVISMRQQSERISQVLDQVKQSIFDVRKTVNGFQEDARNHLAQIAIVPTAMVEKASKDFERNTVKMSNNIKKLTEAHEAAVQTILDQSQSASDKTSEHNEALARQLEQSRDLYRRTFDGLAGITESLAQKAEARP